MVVVLKVVEQPIINTGDTVLQSIEYELNYPSSYIMPPAFLSTCIYCNKIVLLTLIRMEGYIYCIA